MLTDAQTVEMLVASAVPVLAVHGVDFSAPLWVRKVKEGDHRKGPWHHIRWDLLNRPVWMRQAPCLYLVVGKDSRLRYAGISRNRMKDRWRVSPAYDAVSGERHPERELFHSQCQKWLEQECRMDAGASFEVRCLHGDGLLGLLKQYRSPLSGFLELGDDFEGIAAAVERWLCNRSGKTYHLWNTAMTC